MLLLGSAMIIVGKFCYGREATYEGKEVIYSNPILLSFFGYGFAIVAYPIFFMLPKKYQTLDPEDKRQVMPFYMAGIPSFLEVCGVTIVQIGLSKVAASIY